MVHVKQNRETQIINSNNKKDLKVIQFNIWHYTMETKEKKNNSAVILHTEIQHPNQLV